MDTTPTEWFRSWAVVGRSTPDGPLLRVLLVREDEAVVVDLAAGLAYAPGSTRQVTPDWYRLGPADEGTVIGRLAQIPPPGTSTVDVDFDKAVRTRLASVEASVGARRLRANETKELQTAINNALAADPSAPTIGTIIGALRSVKEGLDVVVHWGPYAEHSEALAQLCKWHNHKRSKPLLRSTDHVTFLTDGLFDLQSVAAYRSWGRRLDQVRNRIRVDPLLPAPPEIDQYPDPLTPERRKFIRHNTADLVFISGSVDPAHLPPDVWTRRAGCVIVEGRGQHSEEIIRMAVVNGEADSLFLSDPQSIRLWRLHDQSPRIDDLIDCLAALSATITRKFDEERAVSECAKLLRSARAGGLDEKAEHQLVLQLEEHAHMPALMERLTWVEHTQR